MVDLCVKVCCLFSKCYGTSILNFLLLAYNMMSHIYLGVLGMNILRTTVQENLLEILDEHCYSEKLDTVCIPGTDAHLPGGGDGSICGLSQRRSRSSLNMHEFHLVPWCFV